MQRELIKNILFGIITAMLVLVILVQAVVYEKLRDKVIQEAGYFVSTKDLQVISVGRYWIMVRNGGVEDGLKAMRGFLLRATELDPNISDDELERYMAAKIRRHESKKSGERSGGIEDR